MSVELCDLRAKITVETDAVLDAIARVSGRDRSDIAREWMHKVAMEQIHVATVIGQRLNAEGIGAAAEGASGRTLR